MEKEHIITEMVNYLLRGHGNLDHTRLNEAFKVVMETHPNSKIKMGEVVSEVCLRWANATSKETIEQALSEDAPF